MIRRIFLAAPFDFAKTQRLQVVEHRKRNTVCNLLAASYSNRDTMFKSEHHAPDDGVLTGVEE
jgi:hypothetical protein